MVKMALSAMIRQVMPTTPLEGLQSALDSSGTAPAPLFSKGIVAVVAFIECSLMSFVFPIRVARVLDVPKRPATFDGRNFGKMIFRRWRTRGPFECPGIPGIVSSRSPFAQRQKNVHYKDERADDLECHADRAHEIPNSPTASGFVRVDATRHSQDAGDVHRDERHVEPDEEQPEVPFAEALTEESASGFGEPIIDSREDHENQCAYEHEMKMSNDEVRIVELPVKWGGSQHDARQSGDQELKEKRRAEQHWGVKAQLPTPHRS